MMSITWRTSSERRILNFHCVNNGQTIVCPKLPLADYQRFGAESIVLDGDELEFIRSYFTGLPDAKSRVVTYVGDLAKFIAVNLP